MNMLVRQFEGTPEEIIATVNLVQYGLADAYETQGDFISSEHATDPGRLPQLEQAQAERFQSGNGVRFGLVDTDDHDAIVGVAMVSEWLRGDQYPFASALGKTGLKALRLLRTPHVPGRPLGIQTLEIDRYLPVEDQFEGTMLLGIEALNIADGREVRTSLPEGDPARQALLQLGFIATERFGIRTGVPGLTQELLIRPRLKSLNKS